MSVEYKDTHDFFEQDLKDLFLSVEWSSGHFPDKLIIAMKNFKTVISAWNGEKLVGRELVERVKGIYKDYQLVDVGSFFTQRPFFDAPSQA
jgi:hypothetical protein